MLRDSAKPERKAPPLGEILPSEKFNEPFADDDYEAFKKYIRKRLGLDLDQYKEKQMRRRIGSMARFGRHDTLRDFIKAAEEDENLWRKIVDKITINVSEFYRNPERFSELERVHLPEMLKRNRNPLVWCAGCSTGEEPYSLSVLAEVVPGAKGIKIEAMDIDRKILEDAKRGIYLKKQLNNVPKDLVNKYFREVDAERYQVEDVLKRRISFSHFDLLEGKFPTSKYDMILCRNVVIYFTEDAKDKLYQNFYNALRPGGVLFIGSTERVNNSHKIGFKSLAPFFYAKP